MSKLIGLNMFCIIAFNSCLVSTMHQYTKYFMQSQIKRLTVFKSDDLEAKIGVDLDQSIFLQNIVSGNLYPLQFNERMPLHAEIICVCSYSAVHFLTIHQTLLPETAYKQLLLIYSNKVEVLFNNPQPYPLTYSLKMYAGITVHE